MKPIEKHEIFEHLSGFLKAKGIEMKDGTYSQGIQKACEILTDTVNLSQKGLERAKVTLDKNINRVRQVIHEKTAPKPPVNPSAAPARPAPAKPASPKASAKKSPARKKGPSRKSRR
jgi:hypothetical protein